MKLSHEEQMPARMNRVLGGLALCLCFGGLLGAAPSHAQDEEGVIADPNSPAGKEYAIPLEQSRREGSGGHASSQDTGGSAGGGTVQGASPPLFGVGIEPKRHGKRKRESAGHGNDEQGNETVSGIGGSGGSDGDGSSSTLPVALALAVVLSGAVMGFTAKRHLSRRAAHLE
jgi:hypothetical protein